jgi:phosphate transport system protein
MWRKLINMWKADNLLDQAWRQSFEMLGITHEMFLEAIEVLRESSEPNLTKEIREKDRIVNKYQQEVRRKVITHCTLRGPAELPAGMVLVSIVIDIERLGDYTKNIVDLVNYRTKRLEGGRFEQDLRKAESAVKDHFIRTKTCIESSDPDMALDILDEYDWINEHCEKNIRRLVSEENPDMAPGEAASLALYFRWLKRLNSHLRNITTSVVTPFDRIGFQPDKPDEDI